MKPWEAKKIRYIKLGKGGEWFAQCLNEKRIMLGFDSGNPEVMNLALSGEWDAIRGLRLESRNGNQQVASADLRQIRDFYEDDGSVLWVTFHLQKLWYAFSDGGKVGAFNTGNLAKGSYRKLKEPGWSCKDAVGNELSKSDLSGNLTKTAATQLTICSFNPPSVEDYLRRRLSAKPDPKIASLESLINKVEAGVFGLIKDLRPDDFELLVELIFANSGWQKTSHVGGNQATTDLDLRNPITGDKIYVQVKSKTDQKQYREYLQHLADRNEFSRMYYIYHTGKVEHGAMGSGAAVVWDGREVARQVVANGLIDWVISKSK